MTEQERRKGGGSKLSRSETVTVRLDPKLRYLAELAARKQRRTLSSYIEWAIEESLRHAPLELQGDYEVTISSMAGTLWDVDDADRFVKLAVRYPELLTHDEQILWKLIRENGYVWRGRYNGQGEWIWKVEPESIIYDRVRESWELFQMVASGAADKDVLPTWRKDKEAPPFNPDDDIPF